MRKDEQAERLWERETFCIYCQRQHVTPAKLRRHVLRAHPDTIRADVYRDELPKEEQE